MNARRLFCLLLLLSAFFSECVLAEEKKTINYSFPVNMGPLNPHLYLPNQILGQMLLYDRLVDYGKNGRIEPSLAASWDVSDDGLEYIFYLRPEVLFSDGQPLSARAVAKNFDSFMTDRERHSWLEVVNKIEKWEAVNDLTFKISLSSPYAPTLYELATFRPFRFLSPAAFPESGLSFKGIQNPVGSGPWKVVERLPGQYDLFERNELYWGQKPQADRLMIKVIPDPLTRAIAMETGEIDLIYGLGQIGFDAFDRFSKDPRFETSISPPMGVQAIAVNTNRAPTNEPAVRKALQYLTNRDEIINGLFLGHQLPAWTICHPDFPYCDLDLEAYPFNLELAAQTLDEAGWKLPAKGRVRERDGKKLEFTFSFIGDNAAQKSLAEAFQAQAAKAGISVVLVGEEQDIFLSHSRDGDFSLISSTTWGPPLEPLASLSAMRQPTDADYHAQLGLARKPEIDQKITRMLATTTDEERAELIREIFTILHEEAVYIPIHVVSMLEVHRKDRLEGVEFATDKYGVPFEKMTRK